MSLVYEMTFLPDMTRRSQIFEKSSVFFHIFLISAYFIGTEGNHDEDVTDPADPRRCKFSYPHEQCWREAEAGCDFCVPTGERVRRRPRTPACTISSKSITVAGWQNSPDMSESSRCGKKSAFGILIEKHLNMIRTSWSFLPPVVHQPIDRDVEKLIKNCHALEQSLGELLSKQSVYRLAQDLRDRD